MKFTAASLSGLALLVAACSQGGDRGNTVEPAPVTPAPSQTSAVMITPVDTPAPAASAPPVLTEEAERGPKGARDVLLGFASALEKRDFEGAWSMLSPSDQRRWSRPTFAALFARLDPITVAISDGSLEGAAGSSYYTAPITITGSAQGGPPARLTGEAVLRRVNDVDGSSAADRTWHFDTLALRDETSRKAAPRTGQP